MTRKVIFERSSQKWGWQGVLKEGQEGNLIVGLKHRKNSILECRIFIVSSLFPRNYSDDTIVQLPPFHHPGGRTRGP